jgi:phosphomethylpyrimidine synthase
MLKRRRENPCRVILDEILSILSENHVVLSLGTALRPASVCDGLDDLYFAELFEQREIAEQAWAAGVPVIVEAAGHVRLDQIEIYVRLSKEILSGAPLRSLGPTPCDVGAGYDHITGSIGGAMASMYGCDFLTCTTRAEHLGLPRIEDLREAVVAFKLAAYVGSAARTGSTSRDRLVSRARSDGKWDDVWEHSLFGQDARHLHETLNPTSARTCSMCGRYCALRIAEIALANQKREAKG